MHPHADILETDIVTGESTGFVRLARTALTTMRESGVPYALIGATALAVRGLPRFTRDIDIVVLFEDAYRALDALEAAGFRSETAIDRRAEPEPMYVLQGDDGELDLLVATSEPESTIIDEATEATVYEQVARVATLEQLLLLYLYSNQPRHLGDFARIVTDTDVDLVAVESLLREIHPEMLGVLRERIEQARHPPPPPARPPRR